MIYHRRVGLKHGHVLAYWLKWNAEFHGEGGNDHLDDGTGDDLLICGAGNDRLQGGLGDDELLGDAEHDRLVGGAGTNRKLRSVLESRLIRLFCTACFGLGQQRFASELIEFETDCRSVAF